MNRFRNDFVWAYRELKSSNVLLLLLISIVCVFLLTATRAFNYRITNQLIGVQGSALGGDRVLKSTERFPVELINDLENNNVKYAQKMSFRTVLKHNNDISIVDVKAVDKKYPARGSTVIRAPGEVVTQNVNGGPASNEVWLDKQAMLRLNIKVGEYLTINKNKYLVSAEVLVFPEPISISVLNPTVIIDENQVHRMGLTGPGARIDYSLAYSGHFLKLAEIDKLISDKYNKKIKKPSDSPSFANSMTMTALQWSNLSFFVQLIISMFALNYGLKHYCIKNRQSIVTLKSLGATTKQLLARYFILSLSVVTIAFILGAPLGMLAEHYIGSAFIDDTQFTLPTLDLGILFVALLILVSFGLLPLLSIQNSFTRSLQHIKDYSLLTWVVTVIIALFAATFWLGLNQKSMRIVEASIAAVLVIYVAVYIATSIIGSIRIGKSWSINYALKELRRFNLEYSLIISLFIIMITAVSSLYHVNSIVVSNWQKVLDSKLPNYFAVGVPADKNESFKEWFAEKGMLKPITYPLLIAPVVEMNGLDVSKLPSGEAKGFYRPLRLTEFAYIKPDNKIIEGKWFNADTPAGEISVEKYFAQRLNLKLGDTLTFQAGDKKITGKITSIRSVRWDSMSPNFFVIFSPGSFGNSPYPYMTSFYFDKSKEIYLYDLQKEYPSVIFWDINMVLTAAGILLKSLSNMFYFLVGVMTILLSFAGASIFSCHFKEHERDWSILKVLGASKKQIQSYLTSKFAVIAFFIGGISTITGNMLANALLSRVFRSNTDDFILENLVILLCCVIVSILVGKVLSYLVINRKDISLLRA